VKYTRAAFSQEHEHSELIADRQKLTAMHGYELQKRDSPLGAPWMHRDGADAPTSRRTHCRNLELLESKAHTRSWATHYASDPEV